MGTHGQQLVSLPGNMEVQCHLISIFHKRLHVQNMHYSDVACGLWRLKSQKARLFKQTVQANNKESRSSILLVHWDGNPQVMGGFHSQEIIYSENVSMDLLSDT